MKQRTSAGGGWKSSLCTDISFIRHKENCGTEGGRQGQYVRQFVMSQMGRKIKM